MDYNTNTLTSALRFAYTSSDFASANHTKTLRLVERSHLLFRLAECHAVLQLA